VIEKVSTGNPKLDELLEGGFPKRSLILLAGGPGAGKTILSAKFIHHGALKGEPGVYVCFAEGSDTFIRSMRTFGMDFRTLVEENRVGVLDLSVGTEIDVQRCLDEILEKVTTLRAERLVIDSITAMSVGLRSELDKRHLIHLLYNLIHKCGCATVMITDMPWGSDRIGEGLEEFIADGIILMRSYFNADGSLQRQLRVLKMRGVNHTKRTHEYVITDNGIEIKT
jgi:circadian clock protein KaiC